MATRVADGSRGDTTATGPPAQGPRATRTSLLAFLVLTFAISWGAWGVALALGGDPLAGVGAGGAWLVGGFGPPLAAVVVAAREHDLPALREGLLRWRVHPAWYGLVLLPLPVAAAAATLAGARTAPDASLPSAALQAAGLFVAMAVVGGGLEELGWRGHALPRLQRLVGPLPAALVIGVIWAVWHLPLYAMTNTTQAESNFGWFALGAVALSVILTWAYNGTGGSVLLAVAVHAGVNTFYSVVVGQVELPSFARFEMAAGLLMAVVAVAVVATTRGRLGQEDRG